uniref:Protein N-terminal glutamine amidohydrolase n=1 Tax=Hypotaenidia okinawae TaxID=2861861 RepID=A0A6G1RVG1_9GRUI
MARPAAAYEAAVPPRPACAYTSCYCEENVWKLCDYIRSRGRYPLEEFYAVFISNDRRMIPLWKQQSGHADEPVVWVRHSVLVIFECVLLQLIAAGSDMGSISCLYCNKVFHPNLKPAFLTARVIEHWGRLS